MAFSPPWIVPSVPSIRASIVRIARKRPAVSVTATCRDLPNETTEPCGPSSFLISAFHFLRFELFQIEDHSNHLEFAPAVERIDGHRGDQICRNAVFQVDQHQHAVAANERVALRQQDAIQQVDGFGGSVFVGVAVVERARRDRIHHQREVGLFCEPIEHVLPGLKTELEAELLRIRGGRLEQRLFGRLDRPLGRRLGDCPNFRVSENGTVPFARIRGCPVRPMHGRRRRPNCSRCLGRTSNRGQEKPCDRKNRQKGRTKTDIGREVLQHTETPDKTARKPRSTANQSHDLIVPPCRGVCQSGLARLSLKHPGEAIGVPKRPNVVNPPPAIRCRAVFGDRWATSKKAEKCCLRAPHPSKSPSVGRGRSLLVRRDRLRTVNAAETVHGPARLSS